MGESGDLQSKSDCGGRLSRTNHHGVSDCLYFLCVVLCDEITNRHNELRGDISRLSITMGFGERCEP